MGCTEGQGIIDSSVRHRQTPGDERCWEQMGFASVGDEMLFVLLVPDITGADTSKSGTELGKRACAKAKFSNISKEKARVRLTCRGTAESYSKSKV